MRKVLGLTIAGVMPFLIAGAFLTPPSVTGSDRDSAGVADQVTIAPRDPAPDAAFGDESESATDVLGNPVTDAVAKYKFDATGSLYELHSPQTELPRLGSPKS